VTAFDAYNRCDLVKFSSLFVGDVEFYHDLIRGTRIPREWVRGDSFICGSTRKGLEDYAGD
jgi:hypothetical protein